MLTRPGTSRRSRLTLKLAMMSGELRKRLDLFTNIRPARSRAGTGAVHKVNVMRVSDGLFLECVRLVAKDYPQIAYAERLVDAMYAHLVRNPAEFDVICTTNMFGDILSDLASEIAGSLGLAASLNVGHNFAIAQAQHGSAPDIAGQDMANPSSLIGSSAMLLDWLGAKRDDAGLRAAGKAVDDALESVLLQPDKRTGDLGGASGTRDFAEAVAASVTA